ncbi:hypothetical protein RO3G_12247 [Rhizopus delemar RA 99-880]|uniref:Uncharacterized protein n=1 Tax=Rhizopus delemar (strain RA 99-880 / ATCC MYA-4621 / FGSC 9543 / NRRL 43880) TaxID=246409 RepID=I1CGF6_RHIO9|nr:hypothetical protein RO3G_12247 [Rhizopus delemar RA 99-880]|eukprot:EIE87536.1 hypothetical protein RO3G_12247 [Rhizopus delemar RA 99-880]
MITAWMSCTWLWWLVGLKAFYMFAFLHFASQEETFIFCFNNSRRELLPGINIGAQFSKARAS